MNKILKYTIETLKYSDISYNYIIGEDGNVYEGRGIYKAGFHFDSILKLLLAGLYLKAIVREHIPREIAKVHFQVFQTRIQLVLLYWVTSLVSYFLFKPSWLPLSKFSEELPNAKALEAFDSLIRMLRSDEVLKECVTMVGKSDINASESPGKKLTQYWAENSPFWYINCSKLE